MGTVWNRYGEAIGTTSGKSYTDNSQAATNTHGGGAQASQPWSGGSSTPTSSSSSSSSSNSSSSKSSGSSGGSSSSSSGSSGGSSSTSSGSSGGSSSSSSSQNNAQWWQANFGYVPSWVSGGSTTTPSNPAPTNPTTPSTPSKPSTPATPPTSSGSSSGSSSTSNPTWQQNLESYKTNTAAGLAEIARAGDVYNQKMAAGDTAGAQAAHTWANQIRDAMGISSMYDSSTGAYKGSGADPVAAYRSSGSSTANTAATSPAVKTLGTNTTIPSTNTASQLQTLARTVSPYQAAGAKDVAEDNRYRQSLLDQRYVPHGVDPTKVVRTEYKPTSSGNIDRIDYLDSGQQHYTLIPNLEWRQTGTAAQDKELGDVYNRQMSAYGFQTSFDRSAAGGRSPSGFNPNASNDWLTRSLEFARNSGLALSGQEQPGVTASSINSETPTAVLGQETNMPNMPGLIPQGQQFQQGSYGFNSNAQAVPVETDAGTLKGVMKDGYTYVPIRQLANMTGSQLGNYDAQSLTIEVNGVKVPVHIDANGVGYTPVRNMAAAVGADVGWEDDGSGVSKVVMSSGGNQAEPPPVLDQQQLDPEMEQLNQIIEQLLQEQQQVIQPPQYPNMPEMPSQEPVSYETFLERARGMINPAYAQARETLSRINQQQRDMLIQKLAGKGQPFGGLREEMEMQLSRDFMSQLSQQDMEQIEEAMKIAQSLSEQDEERARYIADQAWQRWQAQTQQVQQQYEQQVQAKNSRLSGLQNLASYLQDSMENRRKAELEAQKFALEQDKFSWDQQKYLLPSGDTIYRYENIPASNLAQMELDWQKHQTPSGSSLASAQASLQAAAMRASASNNPSVTEIKANADAIANGFTDQMLSYPDPQSLMLGTEQFISANVDDPYVAAAFRNRAKYLADNHYYQVTTDPFSGQTVKKPGAGPYYGKQADLSGNVANVDSLLTPTGNSGGNSDSGESKSWWQKMNDTISTMHGF